jgi:hypothetical protein
LSWSALGCGLAASAEDVVFRSLSLLLISGPLFVSSSVLPITVSGQFSAASKLRAHTQEIQSSLSGQVG